jgi:hypothetical protein
MIERSIHSDSLEDRGWDIRRNYLVKHSEGVISRLAGSNTCVTFETLPGRKTTIIYDPSRAGVIIKNRGVQGKDMLYLADQLSAAGYAVAGNDAFGNVYGVAGIQAVEEIASGQFDAPQASLEMSG